jgi:hypothetical protein
MVEHLEPLPPAVADALRGLTGPASTAEVAAEADLVPHLAAAVSTGGPSMLSLVRLAAVKKSTAAAAAVLVGLGATGAAAATGTVPIPSPFGAADDPVLVSGVGPDETTGPLDDEGHDPAADDDDLGEATDPEPMAPDDQDPVADPAPETHGSDETGPVDQPEATDPEDPAAEDAPDDDPATGDTATGTGAAKPECDGGWANHGEYVSAVARWASGPDADLEGRTRGSVVSEAARSGCGRTSPATATSNPTEQNDPAAPLDPVAPSAEEERPTAPPSAASPSRPVTPPAGRPVAPPAGRPRGGHDAGPSTNPTPGRPPQDPGTGRGAAGAGRPAEGRPDATEAAPAGPGRGRGPGGR